MKGKLANRRDGRRRHIQRRDLASGWTLPKRDRIGLKRVRQWLKKYGKAA